MCTSIYQKCCNVIGYATNVLFRDIDLRLNGETLLDFVSVGFKIIIFLGFFKCLRNI